MTDVYTEIRKDMAAKGYVYYRDTRNHPADDGLRRQCRNIENEDYSKLIFDFDAYRAHGN